MLYRDFNLPDDPEQQLLVLRKAIDEGDASGIAEGDVFARVLEKLGVDRSGHSGS